MLEFITQYMRQAQHARQQCDSQRIAGQDAPPVGEVTEEGGAVAEDNGLASSGVPVADWSERARSMRRAGAASSSFSLSSRLGGSGSAMAAWARVPGEKQRLVQRLS